MGLLHFFTLKSLGTLNKFFYVFVCLFFKDNSSPDDDVLSAFLIIATYLWFACVEEDSENS